MLISKQVMRIHVNTSTCCSQVKGGMTINTLPSTAIEQLQQVASETEVSAVKPVQSPDAEVALQQRNDNAANGRAKSTTEAALQARLDRLKQQRQRLEQDRRHLQDRTEQVRLDRATIERIAGDQQRQFELTQRRLVEQEGQDRLVQQRLEDNQGLEQQHVELDPTQQVELQSHSSAFDASTSNVSLQNQDTEPAINDAQTQRLQAINEELEEAQEAQTSQDIIETLRQEAELMQTLLRQQIARQSAPEIGLDNELGTVQQDLQEEVERSARRLQNNQPASARLGNFIDQLS